MPVAEIDGEVVFDSMRIVERLEALAPEPRALSGRPRRARESDVFIEWFNEVWKGPPNELDDELAKADPDPAASRT